MKETSTIGFEYIAEKMHEQQLQLDSALMRSIQETPGMRGEALPYQFRSEWSVTCLPLASCSVWLCFSAICCSCRRISENWGNIYCCLQRNGRDFVGHLVLIILTAWSNILW